jgi:hypothetical protein
MLFLLGAFMRDVLRGVALAGAILGLVGLTAPDAGAACANPPKAPIMPQGATASAEDMKDGRESLQKYVNILQDYQKCMEQLIKNAPPDTKPEVKQQWQANADVAIDAAHEIADVYSIQLRAFKARQE